MPSNPNGAKCVLCGYNKHTERCHIIPKCLTKFLEGYIEYTKFDNSNVIDLCKNHHWEYDHDLMDDVTYENLINIVIARDEEYSRKFSEFICGKVVVEDGKRYTIDDIKRIHKTNAFILKHRDRLERLGFLKDK